MKKTVLLLLVFALSFGVFATPSFNDTSGVIQVQNAGTVVNCVGSLLSVSQQINLTQLTTYPGDTTTRFLIYDGQYNNAGTNTACNNATALFVGTISANSASFSYVLNASKNYTLAFSASGAQYRYNSSNGLTPRTGSTGIITYHCRTDENSGCSSGFVPHLISLGFEFIGVRTDYVTLLSQNPADITDTNLLSVANPNATYNYSKDGIYLDIGLNSTPRIKFYHTITSDVASCVQTVNGSCIKQNGTYTIVDYKRPGNVFYENNESYFVSYPLSENIAYPYSSNVNFTGLNTSSVNNITLTGTNNFLSDEILNISNVLRYGFYEVNAISSASFSVYYYNSSYNFSGNVNNNPNVVNFCNVNNVNSFNHTHDNGIGDNLCPFNLNASGYISNVLVSGGGFLIRGNTNGVTIGTVPNVRNGSSKVTSNNGASWTNNDYTIVSHLHQHTLSGTRFCHYSGADFYSLGNQTNSTVNCDTLDSSNTPPSLPFITNPTQNLIDTRIINITWLPSTPSGANIISSYNITLRNIDGTLNTTVANLANTTRNYLWNTYDKNLFVNTNYTLRVTAFDNVGSQSYDERTVYFTRNGLLIVNAFNGSSLLIGNTTFLLNSTYGVNTTVGPNGSMTFDIVKDTPYRITVNNPSFSLLYFNLTPTANLTYANGSLLSLNTFDLTFLNESTNNILSNQTVYVEVISSVYAANFTTSTSRFNITMLTPSNYTIRYYADSRVPRDYYVTLTPQSYNNISLYVLDHDISQTYTPIILDQNTVPVAGATVSLLRYYVSSNDYVVVEMARTDTNGQAVLRVVPNIINYKLILQSNSFSIVTQPQKFTSATNTYTLNTRQSPLTSYNALPGILYNFSFNQLTNTYIVNWADSSNIVTGACLYVDKIKEGRRTRDYESCSTGNSGSMIYTVTDVNDTRYEATAFLSTSTTYTSVPLGTVTYDFAKKYLNFGLIGMLLTVFVVLAVAFIGGENGTRGIVVTGVIAIIFMGVFGIIPYTQETIIGIVIIAGIIIYKLRGSA